MHQLLAYASAHFLMSVYIFFPIVINVLQLDGPSSLSHSSSQQTLEFKSKLQSTLLLQWGLKSPEDTKQGLNRPGNRKGHLEGYCSLWYSEGRLGRGGYFPTLTTLAACTRHQAGCCFWKVFKSSRSRGSTPPTPHPSLAPGFYSCQVFPPASIQEEKILQLHFFYSYFS